MRNGFLTLAAASPAVHLADPASNVEEAVQAALRAYAQNAGLLLFPQFSLTGSDCRDLFGSGTLLDAAEQALLDYADRTSSLKMLSVLGLPVRVAGQVKSCAAVVGSGEILGMVPLDPDTSEVTSSQSIKGIFVPYGTSLTFECEKNSGFSFCLHPDGLNAGASLYLFPDALVETADSFEHMLSDLTSLSRETDGAVLYVNEGPGGASTDGVYGGGAFLLDRGTQSAIRMPFCKDDSLLVGQIDPRLFASRSRDPGKRKGRFRPSGFHPDATEDPLTLPLSPHPFFPDSPSAFQNYADRVLAIQAHGLAGRIRVTRSKTMVLGLSGGLDSTWALRVCTEAARILGRTNASILAVGMPGFGTTVRTRSNAERLCEVLDIPYRVIPITDSVRQHFRDIGQPEDRFDAVFENAQARERTQILMDLANMHTGLVVGTGDLSELALGFATYGGDQISMYGVNATLPKTAIRELVRLWASRDERAGRILTDILDTPISPELLPADSDGGIAQKTETIVGPYVLHDFFLYHFCVSGATPRELLRMASHVFGDQFEESVLTQTLEVFLKRFFSQQFKRSCMPDGPVTGPVSFSPRTGIQMPSDADSKLWLADIQNS